MRTGVRTIIRLLLMLLVLAAIAPFALPLKEGRPLLSLSALKLPALPSWSELSLPEISLRPEEAPQHKAEGEVVIYRWRGEGGSWQFSNEAPPAGVAYESVTVYPDANLLPGSRPDQQPPQDESMGEQPRPAVPLTLSPQEIGQLFDRARGVQKLMDERQAQQREASR